MGLFNFNKKKVKKADKRGFEAASRNKRLSAWSTPSTKSINAETNGSLTLIRARSRDLVVNNPYAENGLGIWVANVIGTGIMPFIKNKGKNKTVFETKLKEWMDDPKLCDVAGRLDYFQMQELMFKSVVRDGEVLIRRRFSKENALNNYLPLQLQIMESDHLDDTMLSMADDDIIQGIKTDDDGKLLSYFLSKSHPGDISVKSFSMTIQRVEVDAKDIIHPMRFDRAGQLRGVPWTTSIIIRLRDIDEYEDAELLRQKIAACFTAFIKKDATAPTGIFNATEDDEIELPTKLLPANIEVLNPGEDIIIANPPSKDGYDLFMKQNLKGVATGLQVPYVLLADDLSDVNYSSYRGGLLQFFKRVSMYQKNIVVAQFCNPAMKWAKEDAELMGFEGAKDAIIRHIPQKKDIIDPAKEVPAMIDGIRAGLYTMSESILEQGKDSEEHFEQLKLDKDKINELELILDSDASQTQKNGAKQKDESTIKETTPGTEK